MSHEPIAVEMQADTRHGALHPARLWDFVLHAGTVVVDAALDCL
jgi:hypothetical protein